MKKIFLITPFAVLAFFTFANIFPCQYLSLKFYILNTPPIYWNDITINYNYGMFSIKDDKSICFYYYDNTNEGICIKKMNSNDTTYEKIDKNEWNYINTNQILYNNYNAIQVEKTKKSNDYYYNIIYIPDKKIAVGYLGLRENYYKYKELIDRIRFEDDVK